MSNLKGIVELNAVELSKEIHNKKVSCRKVMEAYLNQIDAVNPAVNAIVSLWTRMSFLMKQKRRIMLWQQEKTMAGCTGSHRRLKI